MTTFIGLIRHPETCLAFTTYCVDTKDRFSGSDQGWLMVEIGWFPACLLWHTGWPKQTFKGANGHDGIALKISHSSVPATFPEADKEQSCVNLSAPNVEDVE